MNFTEYWKQNEDLYTQLGVTKAAAKKIWYDCLDNFEKLFYTINGGTDWYRKIKK